MKTKSKRNQKWTDEEDDRLEEYITDDCSNLHQAFEDLAKELSRTTSSIQNRWYGVLNNPSHPKYRGTRCFVTICRTQALINKKVLTEKSKQEPVEVKTPWWVRILNWFK